jgi:hypothetical protein
MAETGATAAAHGARLHRLLHQLSASAPAAAGAAAAAAAGPAAAGSESGLLLSGGAGAMQPTDIQMGGIWFGPFSEEESDMGSSPNADATIHAALALGVRDFDTAPM